MKTTLAFPESSLANLAATYLTPSIRVGGSAGLSVAHPVGHGTETPPTHHVAEGGPGPRMCWPGWYSPPSRASSRGSPLSHVIWRWWANPPNPMTCTWAWRILSLSHAQVNAWVSHGVFPAEPNTCMITVWGPILEVLEQTLNQ